MSAMGLARRPLKLMNVTDAVLADVRARQSHQCKFPFAIFTTNVLKSWAC